MARYHNTTRGDLTMSDGTTIAAHSVANVEPKTVVEQAWVASGALLCLDEPAKTSQKQPEPAKQPAKTDFSVKK